MNKLRTALCSLDFVSEELRPTINFSSRLKNSLGGILSVIIALTMIVFGILFGRELFVKDNPFSTSVEKQFENSEVNLHDFPLAFTLFDSAANDMGSNEEFMKHLYMAARLYDIPDLSEDAVSKIYKYPIVECSAEIIKEEYFNQFKALGSNRKLFCFDLNKPYLNRELVDKQPIVKNIYGDSNSAFFYFYIERCIRGGVLCSEFKAPNDVFYIKMYSIESFLNQKDHENPVSSTVTTQTFPIDYSIGKREFIDIELAELYTDDGWLVADESRTEWTKIGNINTVTSLQQGENTLMQGFTFSSPKVRKVVYRRYMKVQELLANLGGFLKGSLILIKIVTYPVSHFVFHKQMTSLMTNGKERKERVNVSTFIANKNANESRNQLARQPATVQKENKTTFLRYLSRLICGNMDEERKIQKYLEVPYVTTSLIELKRQVKMMLEHSEQRRT